MVVSFGQVEIYEFSLVVGDRETQPSRSKVVRRTVTLDEYDESRRSRRRKRSMPRQPIDNNRRKRTRDVGLTYPITSDNQEQRLLQILLEMDHIHKRLTNLDVQLVQLDQQGRGLRPSTAKDRFSARKISQTPTSSVDTQRPRYAIYI